jgi:hypothetical protein
MRVPFLDLSAHHHAIQDEILAAIREVNSHLSLAKTAHACAV